ncbi:hypothetical protein [Legionella quinlivanii]|uniref:hypothetical protein n=1 Tax=Legionella quinlivanii TaxID=45073 RepID=UPI002242FEB7|nr:hypothetical protein [Legionella quinlivanii]MCW8451911.1 hypothetical protein [Legionella quinlivanii]
MTISSKKNLNFIDETLGDKGFLIWPLLPMLIFSIFMVISCVNSILHLISIGEDILGELMGGAIFAWLIFTIICNLGLAFSAVQEVYVDGESLLFRLYFGQKKTLTFHDITDIKPAFNNWLFIKSLIYKKNGEHLELIVQSGKKIYIGDNTNNYNKLREYLVEAFNNKKQSENKNNSSSFNFIDPVYGPRGEYIWFKLGRPLFFVLLSYCGAVYLSNNLTFVQSLMLELGVFSFVFMIFFEAFSIFVTAKTAQEVRVDDVSKMIKIKYYFGRVKKYSFSQINSVVENRNNWVISETSETFSRNGNRLTIRLKNRKIYVSDSFDGYKELKDFFLHKSKFRIHRQ